mmetsp:Transcript_28873/g.67724  ORF Transcript_28873/g.67724 Transcript_28873/m.67724 type:complete len:208 (-) Transcript_28873:264-887(-)
MDEVGGDLQERRERDLDAREQVYVQQVHGQRVLPRLSPRRALPGHGGADGEHANRGQAHAQAVQRGCSQGPAACLSAARLQLVRIDNELARREDACVAAVRAFRVPQHRGESGERWWMRACAVEREQREHPNPAVSIVAPAAAIGSASLASAPAAQWARHGPGEVARQERGHHRIEEEERRDDSGVVRWKRRRDGLQRRRVAKVGER